ncbi:MAG: hypothetical protein SNJ59_03990 [Aggregatilineales bacterium]
MRRWSLSVVTCIISCLLLSYAGIVFGQGGVFIGYGANIPGRIAPETPLVMFNFNGSAGDLVRVRAIGTQGDLNPTLSLIAPDQQRIAASDDHVFGLQRTDAWLSLFLPQTGQYVLMLGGAENTTGEFLLQLQGRGPVLSDTLLFDAPVLVDIPLNPPRQYFAFEASPSCPTTLTITNLSAGFPFSFPYAVTVRDQTGTVIGEVRGGRQLEDRLTVAAGSGRYEVDVTSINAITNGQVLLTVTCAENAPSCVLPVIGPPVFATPTPTPTPPAGQLLMVQAGGPIGYGANVIGTLSPQAPMINYTFVGAPGDTVDAQALALDSGLDPTLMLLAPSGAPLLSSGADAFAINEVDAALSLILPETGTYALLVGAENNSSGAFMLRLQGRGPVETTLLPFGVPVTVDAPLENPNVPISRAEPQYFAFDARPDCPTTLTIFNLSGGRPITFPFAVRVRGEDGIVIGEVRGGRQTEDRLTVAPNSGRYEVEVLVAEPDARGTIQLLVSCGEGAPSCETFRIPVSTPRPGWTPTFRTSLTPTVTPIGTPTGTPTADGTPTPFITPTPYDPCPEYWEEFDATATATAMGFFPADIITATAVARITPTPDFDTIYRSGIETLFQVEVAVGTAIATGAISIDEARATVNTAAAQFRATMEAATMTAVALALEMESSEPELAEIMPLEDPESGSETYDHDLTDVPEPWQTVSALLPTLQAAYDAGELSEADARATLEPFLTQAVTALYATYAAVATTEAAIRPLVETLEAQWMSGTLSYDEALGTFQALTTSLPRDSSGDEDDDRRLMPLETPDIVVTLMPQQTPQGTPPIMVTPTPTPSPMPTLTPFVTPTPMPTATPCPTRTPTPTATNTQPPTLPPPTLPRPTLTPTQPLLPTLTPSIPFCGDGICQFAEGIDTCDCYRDCANNPAWSAACFPTITPVPFCGDGICQFEVDGCQCRVDCANDPTWLAICFPTPAPFCGDGICQFEVDGCQCRVDCANDPTWLAICFPTPVPFCGDGICQFDVDGCQCRVDCANDPTWLRQCT